MGPASDAPHSSQVKAAKAAVDTANGQLMTASWAHFGHSAITNENSTRHSSQRICWMRCESKTSHGSVCAALQCGQGISIRGGMRVSLRQQLISKRRVVQWRAFRQGF